jgi:hypothetical protein
MLKTAVERAVFRSGSSLSAVLSLFRYSHETHPSGSDTHGCLTLHFANNGNERRAKSLKPTLPSADYGSYARQLEKSSLLARFFINFLDR